MNIYVKTENRNSGEMQESFLGGILKIKKNKFLKCIYFCKIKIYYKRYLNEEYIREINNIKEILLTNTSMMLTVAKEHSKIFPQFKNKHLNKEGVLIATGPTLLHYNPLKSKIHIAVNNAYKKIVPDYWFAIDGQNIYQNYEELKATNFVKFYGQCIIQSPFHQYRSIDETTYFHIPDSAVENSNNGYKFYFDHPSLRINRDIESQPLPDLGSCVFSAIYFAIYTGIKKLYIVGCDSKNNGYFNGAIQKIEWETGEVQRNLLRGWRLMKEYIEIFHPDVEIISVNPVGLKGMFRDVYTQSYLNANPEIKEELGSFIEILDENMELV